MASPARTFAVTVAVLAATVTVGECGYREACTVTFRGPLVENGEVTELAIASCDPAALPQEHYIEAWIEYRATPDAEWRQVSNKQESYSQQVPGSADAGFKSVEVSMRTLCVEGQYRGAAYVEGLSEPVADHPDGREFEFTLTSSKRRMFSVGDCVVGVTQ